VAVVSFCGVSWQGGERRGVYLRSWFLVGEGSEGDFFDTHDCCYSKLLSSIHGDSCKIVRERQKTVADCVWGGFGGDLRKFKKAV
jgi:hypothetical protein